MSDEWADAAKVCAVCAAFAVCFSSLSSCMQNTPPPAFKQNQAQMECIKQRGSWSDFWNTCKFDDGTKSP